MKSKTVCFSSTLTLLRIHFKSWSHIIPKQCFPIVTIHNFRRKRSWSSSHI